MATATQSDPVSRLMMRPPAWLRAAEWGWLPDWMLRLGIRMLLRARLREASRGGIEDQTGRLEHWVKVLRDSPIAPVPEAANRQHYEQPVEFFRTLLGPHLKYSAGYWPPGVTHLAQAEEAALDLVCQRAQIADGQTILDLGCGWGSFSLYAASRYPSSRILSVSNSRLQAEWIKDESRRRGLYGIEVQTADVNTFDTPWRFDRIVSIEMFEHVRNYEMLLRNLASWGRDQARLLVHVFCHRSFAYPFEATGPTDWMAREFFSGGQMPSADLLLHFQDHWAILDRWALSGTHYAKTCRAWMDQLDGERERVLGIFATSGDGTRSARVEFERWRLFILSCETLFGFRGGREWLVSQLLFRKR